MKQPIRFRRSGINVSFVLKTTPADALRISFTESKGPLCINNVEAFLAPPLLEQPYIMRNAQNEVRIGTESEGADIYYTTDGTELTAQSAKI